MMSGNKYSISTYYEDSSDAYWVGDNTTRYEVGFYMSEGEKNPGIRDGFAPSIVGLNRIYFYLFGADRVNYNYLGRRDNIYVVQPSLTLCIRGDGSTSDMPLLLNQGMLDLGYSPILPKGGGAWLANRTPFLVDRIRTLDRGSSLNKIRLYGTFAATDPDLPVATPYHNRLTSHFYAILDSTNTYIEYVRPDRQWDKDYFFLITFVPPVYQIPDDYTYSSDANKIGFNPS